MRRCKENSRDYYKRLPSLFNRNVLGHFGPDIFGTGANQAIISILLQNVRSPAGNTTTSKNGRIQINWNTQHVVDRSRVEIDVCIEALVLLDILLNDTRDLIPAAITSALPQLLRYCSQVRGARVFCPIDAV